jgi:hypothetical protein
MTPLISLGDESLDFATCITSILWLQPLSLRDFMIFTLVLLQDHILPI